jgi:hypothetical protein
MGGLESMNEVIMEFVKWFGQDWWSFIDALVTIVTVSAVLYNLWQIKKQLNPIQILIKKNDVITELPSFIIRKNFTRSEVQGVLRSLHKGETYDIAFTGKAEFLKAIVGIQRGDSSTLIIPILPEDTFELKVSTK